MGKELKGTGKSGQTNTAYLKNTIGGMPPKKDREEIERCSRPQATGKSPKSSC